MDTLSIQFYLVAAASVVVVGGAVLFFLWASQYFARRAYRHVMRRHLYVPIEATVTGSLPGRQTTLYVAYEYGGKEIENRFLTSFAVAHLAEQSQRVSLLIDPDYPNDVVVDPQFEKQAAKAPEPPARKRTWQDHLFDCGVLVAVGLSMAVRWKLLPTETFGANPTWLMLGMAVVLMTYTAWRLLAGPRQAANEPPNTHSDANDQDAAKGM